MTVTQIAYIRPQAGKHDDVEPYLRRLVEGARKEEGTLIYLLNRSEDEFVLYEMYTDEDALKAHNDNEALHELVGQAGELLTGPPAVKRISYIVGTGTAD
jgi:quinol monooxygenase YgiN